MISKAIAFSLMMNNLNTFTEADFIKPSLNNINEIRFSLPVILDDLCVGYTSYQYYPSMFIFHDKLHRTYIIVNEDFYDLSTIQQDILIRRQLYMTDRDKHPCGATNPLFLQALQKQADRYIFNQGYGEDLLWLIQHEHQSLKKVDVMQSVSEAYEYLHELLEDDNLLDSVVNLHPSRETRDMVTATYMDLIQYRLGELEMRAHKLKRMVEGTIS